MFERFLRKNKTAVIVPAPDNLSKPTYVPPTVLKTRKWVVVPNREGNKLGIIASLKNYGVAEVHFVDEFGITIEIDHSVMIGNIRLAKYDEIPEVRRPKMTRGYAATLGYF